MLDNSEVAPFSRRPRCASTAFRKGLISDTTPHTQWTARAYLFIVGYCGEDGYSHRAGRTRRLAILSDDIYAAILVPGTVMPTASAEVVQRVRHVTTIGR